MAAADAGRLHRARGGEIRRAQAHAVQARRGRRDGAHVVDALGGLQDRMHQDRLCDAMAGLEQRKMPIDEMHVPGTLDLRQHHDVESVADLAHDPRHVVEKPG